MVVGHDADEGAHDLAVVLVGQLVAAVARDLAEVAGQRGQAAARGTVAGRVQRRARHHCGDGGGGGGFGVC